MELFAPINKANDRYLMEDLDEGVHGDYLDEISFEADDEELLELSRQWDDEYSEYEQRLRPKQDMNEQFWLGTQNDSAYYDDNMKDNLIFESVETFLPLITKTNPEPLVYADNTPQGNILCNNLKNMIAWQMDELVLRQKVRRMARHWSLYYIGVIQATWNADRNDIDFDVVHPKMIKMDPTGYLDEKGKFHGEWVKKKIKTTCGKLIKKFPEHADYIRKQCDNKLGTTAIYSECWTNEILFFHFKDRILHKSLNPHFNYNEEIVIDPETGEQIEVTTPGENHFEQPQMPFIFLGVYSLGTQPHDVTSPLEQNIPLQRRINKRNKQLDQNIDGMNNGIAMSGDAFNKEQAAEGANALRRGNPLWVPKGDVNRAFKQLNTPGLPSDVYNNLQDSRNELRNIYGVSGSTPEGIEQVDTVRQSIMARQFDASRNSFPIEAIEQVYDQAMNWMVQLFKVYYDQPKTASIIGQASAGMQVTLSAMDINRKIQVSVREGSLIPKDELSQANQSIQLFEAGALDPMTLYEKLGFANPQQSYNRLLAWKNNQQIIENGPDSGNSGAENEPATDQANAGDTGAVDNTPAPVELSSVPINKI